MNVEEKILKYLPLIKKKADEDAYASAVYGLVKAVNRLEGREHPAPEKYIWRVIHGHLKDYYRNNKLPVEFTEYVDSKYPSHRKTLYDDSIECFMARLNDFQKEVLTLLLDGYTDKEVAERLNKSRAYITKTRLKLKELL